jgi:hypothetical protein
MIFLQSGLVRPEPAHRQYGTTLPTTCLAVGIGRPFLTAKDPTS